MRALTGVLRRLQTAPACKRQGLSGRLSRKDTPLNIDLSNGLKLRSRRARHQELASFTQ